MDCEDYKPKQTRLMVAAKSDKNAILLEYGLNESDIYYLKEVGNSLIYKNRTGEVIRLDLDVDLGGLAPEKTIAFFEIY